MRLIDVDNFLKRYSDQVPGDTIDAVDLRLALLKEPKVDAITIEWIVKWAWAFMDKNTEGYKMAMELLHDWEAENDKI